MTLLSTVLCLLLIHCLLVFLFPSQNVLRGVFKKNSTHFKQPLLFSFLFGHRVLYISYTRNSISWGIVRESSYSRVNREARCDIFGTCEKKTDLIRYRVEKSWRHSLQNPLILEALTRLSQKRFGNQQTKFAFWTWFWRHTFWVYHHWWAITIKALTDLLGCL